MEDFLPYLLISVISFLIMVFITRAIFSIPKFIRYKEAELKFLREIARKNNVEEAIIKSIVDEIYK